MLAKGSQVAVILSLGTVNVSIICTDPTHMKMTTEPNLEFLFSYTKMKGV